MAFALLSVVGARQLQLPRAERQALARRCERGGWDLPDECRRAVPCDLRAFDPGPKFNRDVLKNSRERAWAKNNVDAPNRHFQNGVEWWVHRALPRATSNVSALAGATRVFVASYYSYMFIFAPHVTDKANAALSRALGPTWHKRPEHYAVGHGHPGACPSATVGALRLTVDTDSSCGSTRAPLPVPYVVSRPQWLVSAKPAFPPNRSTLVFMRCHLPRTYIETRSVRRMLLKRLAGQPGVLLEAATSKPGASYEPHAAYLHKMTHATFCLAPRGDTASSKRIYEAIAAGCIPVIIADSLRLPFRRRLRWEAFSLRVREADVLADPRRLLAQLRAMPEAKVARMQRALLRARPSFLWHLDPTRRSAVDAILEEMCDGADRAAPWDASKGGVSRPPSAKGKGSWLG